MKLEYLFAKFISRLTGSKKPIIKYLKKKGVNIGEGCNIYSDISTGESELIAIGNNVTISADVVFVTHDNSCIKINPNKSNLFGRIRVGDNCFIGQRSTILYGVTLANNIIVASGSVVTKSFDTEKVIIGGNPARIITTWEVYEAKNAAKMMTRAEFADAMFHHDESKLVEKPVSVQIASKN